MASALVVVLWILKVVFGLCLALLSLLAFAILLATLPALVFFCQALYSDWALVKPLMRASQSGDKELHERAHLKLEDAESLIPAGAEVSSSVPKTSTSDSGVAPSAPNGSAKTDSKAKIAASRTPDLEEGESIPLKPVQSDEAELEEFLETGVSELPQKAALASRSAGYGRRVVVVIPALNEEASLPDTLDNLNALQPPVSLIVVADGGSTDKTREIAKEKGAVVVECEEKGRAKQMNAGAREAAKVMRQQDEKEGEEGLLGSVAGDSLFCFLHADTQVPKDLVGILQCKFAEPSTCCAGFVPLIAIPGRLFWMLSMCDTAKTWFCAAIQKPRAFAAGLRTLYGDQAICCCSRDFFRVGGFDESMPILEDADLCERLHQELTQPGHVQKVSLIPRFVVTSGRRFEKIGTWKSLIINLRFAFAYLRRAAPEELQDMYEKLYKDIR